MFPFPGFYCVYGMKLQFPAEDGVAQYQRQEKEREEAKAKTRLGPSRYIPVSPQLSGSMDSLCLTFSEVNLTANSTIVLLKGKSPKGNPRIFSSGISFV
jgi:hypothetical protein